MKENVNLFVSNQTWNEFRNHKKEFIGKIPRIFDMVNDDLYLTSADIAEIMAVNEETVRRWCRTGKLRVLSPAGRYKVLGADLKEFAYQWWRKEILK